MTDDINAAVDRALDRLDKREDPPPAPELPPVTERLCFERTLKVYELDDGKGSRRFKAWAGDKEIDPRTGVGELAIETMRILSSLGDVPQPVFRAARAFLSAVDMVGKAAQAQQAQQKAMAH
jgi:hypothetical protein